MLKNIFLLTASLSIMSCTQASLALVNLPTGFDDNPVITNIVYGPLPSQKMDIYIPAASADKKADVIVFLYGGRWSTGNKEDYKFVGTALAAKGFVTVIPDYRKYPEVRFPVFVNDSAAALAWTYDHIEIYHGNPHHIFLLGHSAGAHIGALLATDARYLAAYRRRRSDVICGFIGLAGPYAFTPDEPDLEDMFGPPENYPKMRATTFVDGHQPPMLLLQGDEDDVVKRTNLDRLVQAIHEKGGSVQTIIYPNTNHISIMRDFTWLRNSDAPVLKDIMEYTHRVCPARAVIFNR